MTQGVFSYKYKYGRNNAGMTALSRRRRMYPDLAYVMGPVIEQDRNLIVRSGKRHPALKTLLDAGSRLREPAAEASG